MKPSSRRNPQRLIVEGTDDKYTVVNLTRAHGVDWDSDGSHAPYIYDAGGLDEALRQLPVSLRTQRTVGLIVDADTSVQQTWARIRRAVEGIVELPEHISESGCVVEANDHARFGAWILPNNEHPGALEAFLTQLIPDDDPIWPYAEEVSQEALRRGALFREHHLPKAKMRTWLAWQEQPGVPPGEAIHRRYFDPDQSGAETFMAWFRNTFHITTSEPHHLPNP